MRISDWSSDVCSSDLTGIAAAIGLPTGQRNAVPDAATATIGIEHHAVMSVGQQRVVRYRAAHRHAPGTRPDRSAKHLRLARSAPCLRCRGAWWDPLVQQHGDAGDVAIGMETSRYRVGIEVIVQRHRSEEHTSELKSLMRNSYAAFCLKK